MHYALDTDDTLVVRTPSEGSGVRRQLFQDAGNDSQVSEISPSPTPAAMGTGLVAMSTPSEPSLPAHGPTTPVHGQVLFVDKRSTSWF